MIYMIFLLNGSFYFGDCGMESEAFIFIEEGNLQEMYCNYPISEPTKLHESFYVHYYIFKISERTGKKTRNYPSRTLK